jgi:FkbM family methyltransferase
MANTFDMNQQCTSSFGAYKRYAHSIRSSYRALSLSAGASDEDLSIAPFEQFEGHSFYEQLLLGARTMKLRLGRIDSSLANQIFDEPWLRKLSFHNHDAYVPILNEEGRNWYDESPMMNFDFFVESYCGMHKNAEVIYDIGGHQGVWALYYAMCAGPTGRVYTFEPSIVNVECAALSLYLNGIRNAIIIPFAVGEANETIRPDANGLLIAGIAHNVNIIRLDHIFWERPDFMKIDIEGYEHELLKSMPDLFDFCTNLHLEIHVPHLQNRGIDYRETFNRIPFDRVRVRKSLWGTMTEVGPDDVLEGFCTLLITPKA